MSYSGQVGLGIRFAESDLHLSSLSRKKCQDPHDGVKDRVRL